MVAHHQDDDWDPVAGLDVKKVLSSSADQLQEMVDYQIQYAKISLIGADARQLVRVINRLEAAASILNRKQN